LARLRLPSHLVTGRMDGRVVQGIPGRDPVPPGGGMLLLSLLVGAAERRPFALGAAPQDSLSPPGRTTVPVQAAFLQPAFAQPASSIRINRRLRGWKSGAAAEGAHATARLPHCVAGGGLGKRPWPGHPPSGPVRSIEWACPGGDSPGPPRPLQAFQGRGHR